MNERIFELAKQADIIQWDTLPSGARTPDHESVVKAKKFAELIVKECVSLMDTEKNFYDNPGTYESDEYYIHMKAKAEAFESASRIIEYYFGVEE